MAVASERIAAPGDPRARHRASRGRPAQVGGVVGADAAGVYALLRGEAPWPTRLIWTQLPEELDEFQTWLLEQRTADDRNFVFAIFDGFRAFADWLVTTVQRRAAVDDLGRHARRRRADRAALRRLARRADRVRGVRLVRADGAVGGERPDAGADARGGARSRSLIGDAARRRRRALAARAPHDHAGARRDADRARVRLPDAGRDPVLGRAGGGGDLHDDLRDPAGRADHGARHPRRHRRHGRGVAGVRRDGAADAVQGAAAARAAPAAARASTRRSCSRSRWS